ncbi:MAG: TetR/AcrR family transcriptional regulator [Rhodospirillaceae bacterium]|nr:TetR/AcrR family transcriptional regulator [Rhodospirillaceae bacterium]
MDCKTKSTGVEKYLRKERWMPGNPRKKAAPRHRQATEERIRAAVGSLLAREGFSALGVRAVAREAGVDPMLIGRYFGGLSGLLESYADSADHWPQVEEVTEGGKISGLPLGERLSRILTNFAESLARRPVTCEILAWESAQRSELTDALDRARLSSVKTIIQQYLPELALGNETADKANALISILGAAIYYVAIRNRNAEKDWGGLGVRNKEGRARLAKAIKMICGSILSEHDGPVGAGHKK